MVLLPVPLLLTFHSESISAYASATSFYYTDTAEDLASNQASNLGLHIKLILLFT